MQSGTLTGRLWCTGPHTTIRTRTCHAEQLPTPQVRIRFASPQGDMCGGKHGYAPCIVSI